MCTQKNLETQPGLQGFYDTVKNSLFSQTSALLKVSKLHNMTKEKYPHIHSPQRENTQWLSRTSWNETGEKLESELES